METPTLVDRFFNISMLLKGLDGVLEVVGGILLLLVPINTINQVTVILTQHELSQDPHDFFANHLLNAAHHLSHSTILFSFIYLVSHGLIKIILVAAVLKQKLWAYPWMMSFLVIFIGYQIYRLSYHPTLGLALLTIFDIFVLALTWLEFKKHLRDRLDNQTTLP
ncbi:MAG TPA: DUF2127 domain-containing protein [Candidatus Saccharimonadales bacterium]|nr:DUF2127 domain-containing protein [Candidatus Saccharimonadales bacterium]